ncbi:PREDICTED: uncharacterized protein LOC108563122 isoform X3 [Nicrophorus vespilloides]|uniref:Uncharacterized protein LOC108563122 isoform X3 n=1 Tax=Nicrophorus vespilloides TaxID=110193 RepID=A0ABM1MRJ9_NICVS|nr:PREDICTED: uncharacterized protein LOC108563122 isoform X3 [Nicrophorus vespilloides]
MLDPTSMESKKGAFQNPSLIQSTGNDVPLESIPKHQHNTAPQHLRLLQYGLKIPSNSQHQHQINNQTLQHQHLHQFPQQGHRHPPPQFNTNIHPNPMHQHFNQPSNQQYILYQKTKNQPIYQSNSNQSLHPHNPLNAPNPQIWVPHQPPVHYHQQKTEAQQIPNQNKQPKEPIERKRSQHNSQQLRSPSAKRPLDAPVTLQGWLHKQGSEGLMLWKKRWFVLSEYCLFYYKGPEEEKLLGSILLPSYKVSICSPDDRVNKKFAFKCEHTNMRTYILAADSQELMMQWIRVLNLACLLQTNVDSEVSIMNTSSSTFQSNENSDSGFNQQYNNSRNTPIHMHSSSNTTDQSNPSQDLSQYNQPLYANAPPKPRRLTDGYQSPSPDVLDRYNEPKYVTLQPTYNIQRSVTKSPSVNIYGNQEYTSRNEHMSQHLVQNAERRTPDTYGRSKSHPARGRYPSDYEDIYAEQYMYKRPLSPLAYNNIKKTTPTVTPIQRTYTPVSMLGPKDIQYVPPLRKSPSSVPRPHSADFLEYEVNHPQNTTSVTRQPRPKSSLDINRNTNDNYFYSEENYADKMRKSAQYLPKMPKYPARPENENNFPLMRSNTQPMRQNPPLDYARKESQPARSRSVLSEGSLSKELDVELRTSPQERFRETLSPTQDLYGYTDDRLRDYDPFTRSASARLANIEQRLQGDGRASINKEGERKREESMKRLLEWKQRMLQSPLNRKMNQNIKGGKSELYYKTQENGYTNHKGVADGFIDRRPSNPFPQYNSYSSDDEENVDRSKETMQAGRTLDTLSTETAPYTSIPVLDSQTDTPIKHDTHSTTAKENVDNTFTKPLKLYNKEAPNIAHVSSLRSEYSEKFEQSPVVTEIKSNGALVKSILAEFEKKDPTEDEHIPATPTKDIETVIEENYMTMTPRKSVLDANNSKILDTINLELDENPYVEMTQGINASLLDPNNTLNIDHQPYEMICFSGGQMEPLYMELHHPKKVQVLDSKDSFKKPELPDILLPSQSSKSTKSDSSDADDEASKDLESLDTPSHPRFSLSDTFRPASYYLGASQTVPELQDSSDSELVSPPPIPRSPPPLEDLEGEANNHKFRYSKRNSDQYFNDKHVFLKGSTQSLDVKKRSFLSLNSFKDQDTSSICSANTDPETRFSRLSHNSNSDVELRTQSDYERMLKRRPVSEEFCDELESLNSGFNKTIDSVDLDKYLQELQINNLNASDSKDMRNFIVANTEKQFHDYENLCIMNDNKDNSLLSNISALSPISMHTHSRDNSRDTAISHATANTFQSDNSDRRSIVSSDFIQRGRPESSASTAAEISGFLQNSSRSTPIIRISSSMSTQEIPPIYFSDRDTNVNASLNQPAPYYYSDLSMNTSNTENSSILTLNNQRGAMNGKRDITHIINPIRCNSRLRNSHSPRQKLMDNTFKLAAEARSVSVDFLNLTDKSGHIDKKNIYESDTLKRLKVMDSVSSLQSSPETRNLYPSTTNEKFNSGSMSNDLNVRRTHSLEGLLENVLNETESLQTSQQTEEPDTNTEGSYLWEEDSIWRERLRSASQRHTKSLDDLDCIGDPKKTPKKATRAITRDVTYVNDNIYNMPLQDKQQKYLKEGKGNSSFTIDREKLRQWDLMSSAPSDSQASLQGVNSARVNTEVDAGDRNRTSDPDSQEPASGSVSLNARDTFPRNVPTKRLWPLNSQTMQSKSSTNINRSHESDYSISSRQGFYPSQHDISSESSRKVNWNENVSAGDLLGRTHEELVLLLIQLRRQSTNTCHSIEACYNEIDSIQAQLHLMDAAKRLENLQKLEQIKQHLLELEKQYEKGKPLVNLVDNMVKLGSLYRSPNDKSNQNPYMRDRLEFNQQVQERRLLAEERRDWNRLNPNHTQLQEKVQQLYQLDRLIQEESGTLQSLQQDKEEIERALGGLRLRLTQGYNDPAVIKQARKQQAILENELSRVHLMLAQNSKKLEETVAGNARLEQELLVLKQKLQISRQNRSSPQCSNAGDSLPCVVGTSAMLESDLQKVQQKVGDLQRQRQELCMQVRQLTDRSNNLQQQIKPFSLPNAQSNQALGNKKKMQSLWRETDLDTMNITDHGDSWDSSTPLSTTPLYINTAESDFYNRSLQSDSTSEDTSQNMIPQEKQEIKTVRIVKRESERRQRDREKIVTGKWDPVAEEEEISSLARQKTQSSTNIVVAPPPTANTETDTKEKSPELSPVFQSEAARQIITEMSTSDSPKQVNRRAVPKEKRRHYTAPHNNLIMKSLNQLPTEENTFEKAHARRARDDLDMERALRQRIDAPDVVRSTLSNKELKYNENTIDNLLGTPNKISIPERYIPEQLPEISAEEQEHRLRKVESIKKMLSDTTIINSSTPNLTGEENDENTPGVANKATSKMIEEKKQREHLLQLNQILAKQVMEMSKIVAVKALAKLPLQPQQVTSEDDDQSPVTPLPLYQQRDNFYS